MKISINVDMQDKSLAIKTAEAMYWEVLNRGYAVKRITINGVDAFKTVFYYSKYLRG